MYIDKDSRNIVIGSRFYLLGILSAVFYTEDFGQIVFPTKLQQPLVKYKQFLDLGVVYKATAITETIEALLKARGEMQTTLWSHSNQS